MILDSEFRNELFHYEDFDTFLSDCSCPSPIRAQGTITASRGPLFEALFPGAHLGAECRIENGTGNALVAQVVGFRDNTVTLAPVDDMRGVAPGSAVTLTEECLSLAVDEHLLGKLIDPMGREISTVSNKPLTASSCENSLYHGPYILPIHQNPPPPCERAKITTVFETGIKSIDAFCTIGYGQRIGIFAPPGVGKSTLLGMLARNCKADIIVVALVGERGREVGEFIEEAIGKEALKRSVIVCATSDQTPLMRALAPFSATTIAEYFRDQGKNVLLLVDSLTRTARAIRDMSLSCGELPIRQGFTPSVYSELPKLLERAGRSNAGSITGIYTLLTNDSGDIDPLAEEAKSLLDGHIVLSAAVAQQGVRPAIDIVNSLSRLARGLQSETQSEGADTVRNQLALLTKNKDILLFGGTPDIELTRALNNEHNILQFLSQRSDTAISYERTLQELAALT